MNRLILVGLIVGAVGYGCGPPDPTVERTQERYRGATTEYLTAHIVHVKPASGGVSFVTDGELGLYQKGQEWSRSFTVGPGEQFRTKPDHHALSYFEVKQVNAASVVLKYSSSFDQRSFGKNLTTIDEGEIELAFH
jgi:hypothetical protein